ncbi:MAG: cbb3-type cytochrome c oxidase subunit 3 [Venatoribacter sp.]
MSEFDGNLHGVITVAMMVTFISIWIWAWRKRHKKVFDRMSELPMEDDLAGSLRNDEKKGNSL